MVEPEEDDEGGSVCVSGSVCVHACVHGSACMLEGAFVFCVTEMEEISDEMYLQRR